MKKVLLVGMAIIILALITAACSSNEPSPTLKIAGIPDQNSSTLARRYDALTTYLSQELDVEVEYVPTVDYAATVTGFRQDEIQMAWFGGLTGVQARLAVDGSQAIAQRPRDTAFHSKFVIFADSDADSLEDLKGLTFTFGSESSTSGHLMPRHYLLNAGVDPNTDFDGPPNYSGSHDKTWKLVESGAFQAGVLNEAVWDKAVEEGNADLSKVRELAITPPYFDYNWTVRGDMDEKFGDGFTERVQQAILSIDEEEGEILELFSTETFIESENSNYDAIQDVAESLGIVESN